MRIKVDEQGTEAVAATTVRLSRGLNMPSIHEFKVDRPFLFLVRDMRTGSILFLGRISDPREQP